MTLRKYNPAFLTDSELIDGFCVRQVEFQSLVETLRETEGDSNVHRIVIGPRGSGKTTLLLRVVIEVGRDAALSKKFIALVLPEERYEVATAGEFWLECLYHLAHQASDSDASSNIRRYYEELRRIQSDRDLNDLCVQALVDFAAEQGKRLLIIAENLNSMFDETVDPDCGWRLREILQTEPRIMLFASATSRFDEIDHPEHAFYGFFDVLMLRQLSTEKCATLWARVSGRETKDRNIRPIEILTGGNPRLVAIAARFGSTFSFRALIGELLDLVDDHTEYFRSQLESLPPRERRVYLALAELWRPATCRDIAELTRLSTSHCSAHIRRLIGRGAVQETGGTPRRKEYYLTERMYNIYYLLRKRGGPSEIVQALIRFMASYYTAPELIEMGTQIASEATTSGREHREFAIDAVPRLAEVLPEHQTQLLGQLPKEFVGEVGESQILKYADQTARLESSLSRLRDLQEKGANQAALRVCEEILECFGSSREVSILREVTGVRLRKAELLTQMGRSANALAVLTSIAEGWPSQLSEIGANRFLAVALCQKGMILARLGREEEAVETLDEAIRRFDHSEDHEILEFVANASLNRAIALSKLGRNEAALLAYDKVTRVLDRCGSPRLIERAFKACVNKSVLEANLGRFEDSIKTNADARRLLDDLEPIQIPEYQAKVLLNQAHSLQGLDRFEESLDACGAALGLLEDLPSGTTKSRLEAQIQFQRAFVLENLGLHEEALRTYELVERNFIGSDDHETVELAVSAVINKSLRLEANGRIDAAMKALDELELVDWPTGSAQLASVLGTARLNKATLWTQYGDYQAATAIATEAIDTWSPSSPETVERAHWIRAESRYWQGEIGGCESDIKAGLAFLVRDDARLQGVIKRLVMHAVRIGSARILELIEDSPSANVFSPLAVALRLDLGTAPRVAREVIEVARDIKAELDQVRLRVHRLESKAAQSVPKAVTGGR